MLPFGNLFASVWIVIFTVSRRPGEVVSPVALAAQDASSGNLIEIGVPRLLSVRHAPYPTGPQALLVTVDAALVVACHLALGWRVPERILDLMVEHRNASGEEPAKLVGGAAGASLRYGLSATSALTTGRSPEQMRLRLALAGDLLVGMAPELDIGRALLRGRYLCAVARINAVGVPVDVETIGQLADDWPAVWRRLVDIVDEPYGLHRDSRLDEAALAAWLDDRNIPWPVLTDGRLNLGDDAFRDMARTYPELRPIKELRATVLGFDPSAITVGRDRRNRTPLRPFASRTGRNQPSAKESVIGSATWIRHLILPTAGTGLALIDWEQQEFGIAAALSGDTSMQAAYAGDDPYLALAVLAGTAPGTATTASHRDTRARFKTCALGIQYGMGAATLARLTGQSEVAARELQRAHRKAFPRYWEWSDRVETQGMLTGAISSVFGWTRRIDSRTNARSLRNFPLQANGAEMLRLACCMTTEAGIKVCAPHHDALLIEAPLRDLDDAVATAQRLMAEATTVVLDGFKLRSSVRTVCAPARWREEKGRVVWEAVQRALCEIWPPARRRHAT